MGLGLYIGAENKPRGVLRRRRTPERLLDELVTAIEQGLADPILKRLFRHQTTGLEAHVQLHPAEESVDFQFQNSWLVCSAKTSSAGPGYHEFLIELLERTAACCELEWVFIDHVREFCDETDFALQRDRQGLRMAMARQLQSVGLQLLSRDDLRQVGLSMPLELRVAGDYFAVSPLGFWQRDWFEMLVARTGDELVHQASQFFPWWEPGLGGEFYRRCGLVKCWIDLRWRPPRDQDERDDIGLTLECLEKGSGSGVNAHLPDETIAELKRLLADSNQNEGRVPQRGIGFRKGDVVWSATGTWTIEAPGYFYDDWEDDRATLVLWYGSRTIWVSSLSFRAKDGHPVSPAEGVGRGQNEPADVQVVESVDKWLHRRYYIVENQEEQSWSLFGNVVTYNTVCIVSIRFSNKSDQSWAESVFNSVSCPEPDDVTRAH